MLLSLLGDDLVLNVSKSAVLLRIINEAVKKWAILKNIRRHSVIASNRNERKMHTDLKASGCWKFLKVPNSRISNVGHKNSIKMTKTSAKKNWTRQWQTLAWNSVVVAITSFCREDTNHLKPAKIGYNRMISDENWAQCTVKVPCNIWSSSTHNHLSFWISKFRLDLSWSESVTSDGIWIPVFSDWVSSFEDLTRRK